MSIIREISLQLETVTVPEESSPAPLAAAHTLLPSQYSEISNLLEVETVTVQEESSPAPLAAAHTSLPSQYSEICNLLAS
jgi:hypothetical protein